MPETVKEVRKSIKKSAQREGIKHNPIQAIKVQQYRPGVAQRVPGS
jgi:hypothetical protein